MTVQNVKKAIVKKEDLPAFDGNLKSYVIRYRILSKDKNRSSHWSPYYTVPANNIPAVNCSVSILNDVVSLVWQQPALYVIKQFDIYFKINSEDWKYMSSVPSTQFSALVNESTTSIRVAIQLPTYPKQYFPSAAIFTSASIEV